MRISCLFREIVSKRQILKMLHYATNAFSQYLNRNSFYRGQKSFKCWNNVFFVNIIMFLIIKNNVVERFWYLIIGKVLRSWSYGRKRYEGQNFWLSYIEILFLSGFDASTFEQVNKLQEHVTSFFFLGKGNSILCKLNQKSEQKINHFLTKNIIYF